ncbi:MAG: penicillin-binding protein activator [Rhodospirillaceae bacterium]|nr:MAG: penicillin-binding protein activator [Rhodospirillaceae bacterium]
MGFSAVYPLCRNRLLIGACLIALLVLMAGCGRVSNGYPGAQGGRTFPDAPPPKSSPSTPVQEAPLPIPSEYDRTRSEDVSLRETTTAIASLSQGSPLKGAPRRVQAAPAAKARQRIAILLPLSGQNAVLGKAMLNTAQMALFDLAGSNFALLPFDTKGTPRGAATAAEAAFESNVSLILGPLLSTSVSAISDAARARNIRVVAFSTDRSVAGRGIYTMGFLPRTQVERVVTFAHNKGLSRFAILSPRNAYGYAVVEELRRAVEKVDAVVTRVVFYDPAVAMDTKKLSEIVRDLADYDLRAHALNEHRVELETLDDEISKRELERLKGQETLGDVDFDAVLLPVGGDHLKSIAPLLSYYDVDPKKVRFLGTGQWDDATIGTEPTLVGGWYATSGPKEWERFVRRYEDRFQAAPPRLASLAYDATALAAVLVGTGTSLDDFSLTVRGGFAGVDGIFRFHPDGLVERGLAVLQVGHRGPRVVSPAPVKFTDG